MILIELPGGYWVNPKRVLSISETRYQGGEWQTAVRMLDGHSVLVAARSAAVAALLNAELDLDQRVAQLYRQPPAEQQPAPWSEQR